MKYRERVWLAWMTKRECVKHHGLLCPFGVCGWAVLKAIMGVS